jgi:hypothetical protein
MNRKAIIFAACLLFAAIVVLVLLTNKGGKRQPAQRTEPWRVVVTLPKTNSNAALTNTLPKGR